MDKVAILIPCYNEARTIGKVIDEFRQELPDAQIYVFNNNSTDDTAFIANRHGAIVRSVPLQGKGNVVRQMFFEVDAERYIMVDGDWTYPAKYVHDLLRGLDRYDMVLGDRLSGNYYEDNKRPFHGFGNKLVKFLVNTLYHGNITDIMTGYRAFSRNFVKNAKLKSEKFEIETEMSIFALRHHYKIGSIPIEYRDRPEGSVSKLNTFKDGIKVLFTIVKMLF